MNAPFKRSSRAVLGLTLEQGRLLGAVVRPAGSGGAVEVLRVLDAPLTLDLLFNEADLVAREIRNALDAADIRERNCVVSVPPAWILSLHGPVPDLAGEDLQSMLEIEAEKGFPRALSELRRAHTVGRRSDNLLYASQLAVPAAHLERLEAVLAKAGLRPKSIAPGLLSAPGVVPASGRPVVTLAVASSAVVIVVADPAGVASLRVVDGLLDEEGSERSLRSDRLVREMRVTLGQLPVAMQEEVRSIRVLGGGRLGSSLVDGLAPFAERMGFSVEATPRSATLFKGQPISETLGLSPGVALAAAWLGGVATPFQFLRPKPSPWERLNLRHSTRKLAWAGGAAAALALLLGGALLLRHFKRGSLAKEWAGMRSKVERLDTIQQDIRKFRPWHDNSPASLQVLHTLSESFPEEGVVSAKSVELMDSGEVSCAGVAKDAAALLKTMEKLASSPRVRSLKLDQSKGKSPLQFTFRFAWGEAVTQ